VIELFVRVQELQTLSKEVQENKVKAIVVLQKKIKQEDIEVDALHSRRQRDKLYTQTILNISLVSCLCNHEETW
jgi:hypothetical protein